MTRKWIAVAAAWWALSSPMAGAQCLRVGYEDMTGQIEEEVWVVDDRLLGCPDPVWVLVRDGRIVSVMSEEEIAVRGEGASDG